MIHKYRQNGINIVLDINSGAVHVVDDAAFDLLDSYSENGLDKENEAFSKCMELHGKKTVEEARVEIDTLIEGKELFADDILGENPLLAAKPVVKAMCLHVAHDCNLRCEYCFAAQGDFNGKRSLMSLETGIKALDYLIENSGNRRNLEVDFFGGEPLMNFDVVKELVHYGRKREKETGKHFRFTLTTNGVLMTDEVMEFLDKNMDNVVLSIDGKKENHDRLRYYASGKGSFDDIYDKLKKFVKMRENRLYFARGTFTSYNLNFSEDVRFLADSGFDSLSLEPVVTKPTEPYVLKEEHLPVIFEQYEALADEIIKRHEEGEPINYYHFEVDLNQGPCAYKRLSGCGAGIEYLAVTPEGELYPCHQFVGEKSMEMGTLDDSYEDLKKPLDFKNAHVYKKEACRNCWARFYCGGGCHANAYYSNGNIFEPYELGCEMEKKRVECAIYVKAALNEKGIEQRKLI